MEVIRRAWTEERVTFKGEFYEFNDAFMTPKPYQRPGRRYGSEPTTTRPYAGRWTGRAGAGGSRSLSMPPTRRSASGGTRRASGGKTRTGRRPSAMRDGSVTTPPRSGLRT